MSITVTKGLAMGHAPTCAAGSKIGKTIGIYTIVTVMSKTISPTAKARLPLANLAANSKVVTALLSFFSSDDSRCHRALQAARNKRIIHRRSEVILGELGGEVAVFIPPPVRNRCLN